MLKTFVVNDAERFFFQTLLYTINFSKLISSNIYKIKKNKRNLYYYKLISNRKI
jgi:hypothetical protein